MDEFTEQTQNAVGDVVISSTTLCEFLSKFGWAAEGVSAKMFKHHAPDVYAEAEEFSRKLSFSTASIYIQALAEMLYTRTK